MYYVRCCWSEDALNQGKPWQTFETMFESFWWLLLVYLTRAYNDSVLTIDRHLLIFRYCFVQVFLTYNIQPIYCKRQVRKIYYNHLWLNINQRKLIQIDCPSNFIILADFCNSCISGLNVNLELSMLKLDLLSCHRWWKFQLI